MPKKDLFDYLTEVDLTNESWLEGVTNPEFNWEDSLGWGVGGGGGYDIPVVGGEFEPNPYDPTGPSYPDPYEGLPPGDPRGDPGPGGNWDPSIPRLPNIPNPGGGNGSTPSPTTPGVPKPPGTGGGTTGGTGGASTGNVVNVNNPGQGAGFSMLNPAMLPLLGALMEAWNGAKDSKDWKNFANEQRDILDPFGKQRPQYQQLLSDYYKDPAGTIERLPGFRAARDLSTRQLTAKSGSQLGGGLNGTLPNWVMEKSSELAALHANEYEKNLHNLSGAQFGPGDYGRVATTAMQESQNAKNNALMAMAMALGGGGSMISGNSGSGGSGGGDFWSWLQQQFTGSPPAQQLPSPVEDRVPTPNDPGGGLPPNLPGAGIEEDRWAAPSTPFNPGFDYDPSGGQYSVSPPGFPTLPNPNVTTTPVPDNNIFGQVPQNFNFNSYGGF